MVSWFISKLTVVCSGYIYSWWIVNQIVCAGACGTLLWIPILSGVIGPDRIDNLRIVCRWFSPPDKSFQDIPLYILHPQVPFNKHLNNSCLKPWSPSCFRLSIAISSQLHVPRHVAPRFCCCPGVRTPVTPGFLGVRAPGTRFLGGFLDILLWNGGWWSFMSFRDFSWLVVTGTID